MALTMALTMALASLPLLTGCGALLLLGGAGSSAIAFATGELQVIEDASVGRLDVATGIALETLGYDTIQATREPERVRWSARTAGGEPVEIGLRARGRERTRIRIRVGTFGDETRSRLVLEQIRQAL